MALAEEPESYNGSKVMVYDHSGAVVVCFRLPKNINLPRNNIVIGV